MSENITDRMIDRGVDIWCKKLLQPHFDNGDDSNDGLGGLLANANIENDLAKEIHLTSKIEVFRVTLTTLLKQELEERQYISSLYVDYGPSGNLGKAAEVAEIPPSLFGCKSDVDINVDCCTSRFGYGQQSINHFPLSDDKWLLTTLRGGDMDKVIKSVERGNPLNLVVETL